MEFQPLFLYPTFYSLFHVTQFLYGRKIDKNYKKSMLLSCATELLLQNLLETFDIFIDIEMHYISVSYFQRNVCKVMNLKLHRTV